MKLQMKKNELLNILSKMVDVATKAVKSDEEFINHLTIEVDPKQVNFKASNGYLSAIYKIMPEQDPTIANSEAGIFTVDATVFRNVVKVMSTKSEDSALAFDIDGDMLKISEAGAKLKKSAKLQLLNKNHDFVIDKPKGSTFKLETDVFCRGLGHVAPFVSKLSYDIRFQMICVHFLSDQTRYVCGDGGCFAIYEYPQNNNIKDSVECLIPANQSFIIQNLLGDEQSFEVTVKKGECYFESGPVILSLKGVPVQEYVNYAIHAYQHDKAVAVFDVEQKDMADAINLIGAVKDKEIEMQGDAHSFSLNATDGQIEMVVDGASAKYRCEVDKPCSFYKISSDKFSSRYAYVYVRDVVSAVSDPSVRFYCITEDSSGVIVVESVKTNSTLGVDSKGIPIADRPEKDRLLFLFAAVADVN